MLGKQHNCRLQEAYIACRVITQSFQHNQSMEAILFPSVWRNFRFACAGKVFCHCTKSVWCRLLSRLLFFVPFLFCLVLMDHFFLPSIESRPNDVLCSYMIRLMFYEDVYAESNNTFLLNVTCTINNWFQPQIQSPTAVHAVTRNLLTWLEPFTSFML